MSLMRERRKSEERNEGNKESGGRKDERNAKEAHVLLHLYEKKRTSGESSIVTTH